MYACFMNAAKGGQTPTGTTILLVIHICCHFLLNVSWRIQYFTECQCLLLELLHENTKGTYCPFKGVQINEFVG